MVWLWSKESGSMSDSMGCLRCRPQAFFTDHPRPCRRSPCNGAAPAPTLLRAKGSRMILHRSSSMPRRWTHWLRLLVIGAVALMAIACTSAPDQNTIQKPSETGANPAPDQSYAFSQKEEYTTAMKSNLDKLNQEIDQLAEKVAHVAAAARADAAEKLQKLRDQAQ